MATTKLIDKKGSKCNEVVIINQLSAEMSNSFIFQAHSLNPKSYD